MISCMRNKHARDNSIDIIELYGIDGVPIMDTRDKIIYCYSLHGALFNSTPYEMVDTIYQWMIAAVSDIELDR